MTVSQPISRLKSSLQTQEFAPLCKSKKNIIGIEALRTNLEAYHSNTKTQAKKILFALELTAEFLINTLDTLLKLDTETGQTKAIITEVSESLNTAFFYSEIAGSQLKETTIEANHKKDGVVLEKLRKYIEVIGKALETSFNPYSTKTGKASQERLFTSLSKFKQHIKTLEKLFPAEDYSFEVGTTLFKGMNTGTQNLNELKKFGIPKHNIIETESLLHRFFWYTLTSTCKNNNTPLPNVRVTTAYQSSPDPTTCAELTVQPGHAIDSTAIEDIKENLALTMGMFYNSRIQPILSKVKKDKVTNPSLHTTVIAKSKKPKLIEASNKSSRVNL